jgi:16S rRNA (guanine527-N7)-methyltransferase
MSVPRPEGAVRDALRQAQERGLLGGSALDEQIAHAQEFALAAAMGGQDGRPEPGVDARAAPDLWLDLGSGGGLPGLVLAGLWPDSRGVLLDSATRRTSFLAEALEDLGWDGRVSVVTARAEEAGRDPSLRADFDVVVARSFGPPAVTAECAAPFLASGGRLVVSEPPPTAPDPARGEGGPGRDLRPVSVDDDRWPRDPLAELGMRPGVAVRGRFGFQVIDLVERCPDRFPRRSGIPAKRPLYRSG